MVTRTTAPSDLPEWLTVGELAGWLGIGRSLAYDLVKRGDVPSVKFGRLLRVRRDGLLALARTSEAGR